MNGLSTTPQLQPEVAAKYKLVNCWGRFCVLTNGKRVTWQDVTLEEADKIYEQNLTNGLLQLVEQTPTPKRKPKTTSESGE